MFVQANDPNHKGNVAEAAIAAAAIKLGLDVLKPLTEHGRYDLVFDLGGRLIRVQCKWAPLRGDVVVVNLAGYRYTAQGQVRSTYSADEVDVIAAYCEELDRSYLLPIELVGGMHALQLRLKPPRNGQRAALNWATDYELPGAVAQLGRACGWQPQGRGFESHQLHPPPVSNGGSSASPGIVGAHVFREHFGWYMERAAAGESFLITRRGKPRARLIPPQPQLASAEGANGPAESPSQVA